MCSQTQCTRKDLHWGVLDTYLAARRINTSFFIWLLFFGSITSSLWNPKIVKDESIKPLLGLYDHSFLRVQGQDQILLLCLWLQLTVIHHWVLFPNTYSKLQLCIYLKDVLVILLFPSINSVEEEKCLSVPIMSSQLTPVNQRQKNTFVAYKLLSETITLLLKLYKILWEVLIIENNGQNHCQHCVKSHDPSHKGTIHPNGMIEYVIFFFGSLFFNRYRIELCLTQ